MATAVAHYQLGRRVVLVLYGGLNVVVSAAVLAGAITPAGGYDPVAMKGHAFLWDPLFFGWGALLVGWLWWSRPSAGSGRPMSPDHGD